MAQPNLVSLIMQFLTPDLIGRIASALGLDRNILQTAIGAAVPGLLAGLSGVAAQPGGAAKLADAARQQSGALANFGSMVGAGGQSSLIEKGSQMLSSLLGGRGQTALTRAVANFAGVGEGASGSLLGMLAPLVMGTVAKEQATRSLDASGIASLFAGQKDSIAAAMPSGFGKMLEDTGLLDSLGGAARTATAAASQTTRAATAAARGIGDAGQRVAGSAAASTNWLYWLIPLLAIGALLIYFLAKPTEQVVEKGMPAVQSLTVGGIDIGKQVTDSVSSMRTALAGITDVPSAQAALPRLLEVTAQIDKAAAVRGQLSAEQRKVLAGMVTPMLASLNQLFDKVLAIPGVAEVLKPAIDAVRTKLAALTT
jgi:hypothetical protein